MWMYNGKTFQKYNDAAQALMDDNPQVADDDICDLEFSQLEWCEDAELVNA